MVLDLSKIFGNPNEGIHSYRFIDFAIIDILMTIIGAFIIAVILKINFFYVFISLFLLGQILHIIFGVKTKFVTLIYKYI
jgi:hypothetical protein